MIRRADDHGVDVAARQEFAEVPVPLAVRAERLHGLRKVLRIYIAGRDYLAAIVSGRVLRVVQAHPVAAFTAAGADHAELDRVVRADPSRRGGKALRFRRLGLFHKPSRQAGSSQTCERLCQELAPGNRVISFESQ